MKPPVLASDYSYWSGLPMNGRLEIDIRPHRGFAAVPTHDGLTLVVAGWPYASCDANKSDIDEAFSEGRSFDAAMGDCQRARDVIPSFMRTESSMACRARH